MEAKRKTKGSWGLRFFIILLGIVLGILFYSILSFIESDIGTIKRPDWNTIRGKYVSDQMDNERDQLQSEVKQLNRKIDTLIEQQRLLSNSTNGLQKTMNQLLSIQRQYIDKGQEFPPENMQTLQKSQAAFLKNQQKDQQFTQDISDLTQQRQQKEDDLAAVSKEIKSLEDEARQEQTQLWEKHRLKVAVLKLSFLIPVFLAVSFLFMKYRTSPWWPLIWAAFLAAFVKVALVAHEYFPTRYFKYIAILVLLAIVVRILVYLIKMIIAPKKDLLIRQYQEHYDKYLCPICSKPIRIGPLRYIGGLKKKQALPAGPGSEPSIQEPYSCPSCGTNLYDKCGHCSQIRHTLLPYCEHCGTHKESKSTEGAE